MDNCLIKTSCSFLKKFNLSNIEKCEIDQKLLDDCVDDVKDLLEIKPPIIICGKQVYQRRDVGFFSSKSIG